MSILVGLGILAGLLGAEEHISAKGTNNRAQNIANRAQSLYNNTKKTLEVSQKKTQEVLLELGNEKRIILESSMKQFLKYYEKIKHINFNESCEIDELSRFSIDQQGAIEMKQMADIYSSTIKSGATGAAAGTVIALAASGSLAAIGADMALAGSFLAEGAIGTAAGIAGSSLTFAAGITPLGAIAAPVLLFTGISAGMKADENLEKANAMYAEAEAASEKMKVSITLCNAICERADMLNGVLKELMPMFSECTSMLAGILKKKDKTFLKKKMSSKDFTEEEISLIAVTRALAGAVKAIIDTPILLSNGSVSQESFDICTQTNNRLVDFNNKVEEIRQFDYKVKPVPVKSVREIKDQEEQRQKTKILFKKIMVLLRNVCAIALGMYIATRGCGVLAELISKTNSKIMIWKAVDINKIAIWLVICSMITFFVGKFEKTLVDLMCRVCTSIGLSVLFLQFCWNMERIKHFILIPGVILIIGGAMMSVLSEKCKNFFANYYVCILLSFFEYPIMFFIYAFFTMWWEFPKTICLVIAFLMLAGTDISIACMSFWDNNA